MVKMLGGEVSPPSHGVTGIDPGRERSRARDFRFSLLTGNPRADGNRC
jgi:hypothetical protein